jgi:hypothetical protein
MYLICRVHFYCFVFCIFLIKELWLSTLLPCVKALFFEVAVIKLKAKLLIKSIKKITYIMEIVFLLSLLISISRCCYQLWNMDTRYDNDIDMSTQIKIWENNIINIIIIVDVVLVSDINMCPIHDTTKSLNKRVKNEQCVNEIIHIFYMLKVWMKMYIVSNFIYVIILD